MHILAIDVGTSGMLTAIYNKAGKIVFKISLKYTQNFIYPSLVEQNPQDWFNAMINSLKHSQHYADTNNITISAVAVTSQRASLIPVDKTGSPLCDAIMWQDKRAIKQAEFIEQEYGAEKIYHMTGLRINPYFVLPRILWLKNIQPELYDKAYKIIGVQDYIIHKLTGNFTTDHSQASRTMLMNIKTFDWEEEILEFAGLSRDKLCKLTYPGEIVGNILQTVTNLTGVKAGTPVVICGGDQQNVAVAMNVTCKGKAEINSGTGSFIIAHTDVPYFDIQKRIICSAAAVKGKWISEASILNTGSVYNWMKEQFYKEIDQDKCYEFMNNEAKKVPTGANGVIMLPHFEGSAAPFWEPMAKGLFFNLSLGTKRADKTRAVIEGIAMEVAQNISLIEESCGIIKEVSIAGGLAKSDFYTQIQADCCNKKIVRYKNNEASSLGAAMIAFTGIQEYNSLEKAQEAMSEKEPMLFKPQMNNTIIYNDLIEKRNLLFKALQNGGVYEKFMN